MALSNKIRKLRFEHDEMTQKRLAELVGVSRKTIYGIENCKHAPTIDVAIRIADVFGISVDQLFEYGYDGKPDHSSSAPKATIVQKKISVEQTIDDSARHASVEEATDESARHSSVEERADDRLSLASLSNVI